MILPSTS